jgi:uncharacterized repeat protein (TIGR01451 family)
MCVAPFLSLVANEKCSTYSDTYFEADHILQGKPLLASAWHFSCFTGDAFHFHFSVARIRDGLITSRIIAMTFFRHVSLLRLAQRASLFALSMFVSVLLIGATASLALPLPKARFDQSLVPPDVPASVLIGDTIKFKVRFKNNAAIGNIGYAPFIDLAVNFTGADANSSSSLCDGIDIDITSIKMIDVNGPIPLASTSIKYGNTPANITSCIIQSAPHPYPGVGTMTFAPGWQLVTIGLPFGSFDPSQPEIVLEVSATVHEYADRNIALAVCARGGFQFTTPTGGLPILEAGASNNVTTWPALNCPSVLPDVLTVKKDYIGPEDETATGPNFVHSYKITLDVATNQTIGNPLTIKDCMPDGMAYQGNLAVTSPIGWGPHVVTAPAIGAIGGCLDVSWPNAAVVGVPGADAVVQFDFFVADHYLNGTVVLDDTCKPVVLSNPVAVTGLWTPKDTRDAQIAVTGGSSQAHQLSAKCIAIQKSVKVYQEFPGGGLGSTPGDTLEYTLKFQISDYKTIGPQIKITDLLSNGQVFQTGGALAPKLMIGDQFGGHTITLTSAHFAATTVLSSTPNCPLVPRSTGITFNISGALMAIPPTNPRQLAGILTGGYAALPTSTIPATGTLVFYAKIADTFSNVALPVGYVDKHDPLCNAVDIQGVVYKNYSNPIAVPPAVSPTQIAEDSSATKISIVTDVLTKSVYAVKRGTNYMCGPSSVSSFACLPGQQVFPGDQVTFRIEYRIPSGDAQSLTIRDWLPLPKFNVSGFSSALSSTCPTSTIPATGSAGCGPTHTIPVNTLATQFRLPTILPQPATNSIQFTYLPMYDTLNTAKKIDLLFTSTVTNQPMTDGLLLTNEVQECEKNTFDTNVTFCQTAVAQVQVREPKLSVRKGVIATSNPNGAFTQPGSPGLAQAPVGATFSLAGVSGPVTSATLSSLFDSNLSNVDANDLATFAVVIENQGGYPAYNVHLDDFIPWNAGLPTCFEFVPSTPVSIRNGAGATLTPIVGSTVANFGVTFLGTTNIPAVSTTGTNIIIITFQVRIIPQIQAGCCENTANLTQYNSSPNPPNPMAPDFVTAGVGGPFTDTARICVGPSASAKCIPATSEAHTTPQQAAPGGQVNATIGEIVRFRLVTIIPEGTTQNLQIRDALPPGLTYIPNTARAVFVANNPVRDASGNPPLGIPTVPAPTTTIVMQCLGAPVPATLISQSPTLFPVGAGTDPSFPAAPITVKNNDNNDSDREYLVIDFNAQVDNIATNQDVPATVLTNSFEVRFTDAFSGQTVASNSSQLAAGAGQASVKIVEPKLTLRKTASPTLIGPAGGPITYTVTITNAGSATAFDLAFRDLLPADFVPGSVSLLTSLPGCIGSTTGGLNLGFTCLSPAYSGLPVAGAMTITYQATVKPQTCPAAMTNQATVTWTSLPGTNGTVTNSTGSSTAGSSGANNGERDGVTIPVSLNDYQAAGSATVNCVIPKFDLMIGKAYDHPPGLTYPDGVSFGFTADCSDPNNSSAPHLVQSGTIVSSHSSTGNQVYIPSIPLGWTCMVTETVPPGTDAHGCHWAPGIAITPNPVTIHTSPPPNSVGFNNNYVCPGVGNPAYDLGVSKTKWEAGSSGSSETFVITVQNVGNQPLTGADLSHLTVTDNLPGGSIVTGYGNTSMTDWNCTPPSTVVPVTCSYIGTATSLAPFAGLPQLQIVAIPGTGTTQYINPANGTVTNTNLKLNCVVISLTGTGTTPSHDDVIPANNSYCIGM